MIKITEIKLDDIPELAKLAYGIWHEYWSGKMSDAQIDYMLDKFQSEHAIKNQITDENYKYFFISDDNQKAGYTSLVKKQEYLFLSKIYIRKEYRYIGVGTKTFDFIKEYAVKNNYNKIRLTVKKDNNKSINAYKKWGFKTVDSVVADIGNGFVMDDYVMEYEI